MIDDCLIISSTISVSYFKLLEDGQLSGSIFPHYLLWSIPIIHRDFDMFGL